MTHWLPISFAWGQVLELGLPGTAGLAAVALIGYLFGRRTRRSVPADSSSERLVELDRASGIARHLESIADTLRQDLASHHNQLARFRRRLGEAQAQGNEQAWKLLCSEAELMLGPTMQLALQLSQAYDAIRQQSDALEVFTQSRIDPLTGVGNGRALEEKLAILLAAAERGGGEFCVALVSLDGEPTAAAKGVGQPRDAEPKQKLRLPELARLLQSCMRGSDFAARYGDEEFVVVMPQTRLAGACVFAARLRDAVVGRMSATVSCGMAEYHRDDTAKSLLGRADSAFYSAKAGGGNRQFLHTGSQIREHRVGGAPRPDANQSAAPARVVVSLGERADGVSDVAPVGAAR